MRVPLENPDLRYLQHMPAGAEYVSQITAQESDRRTRTAFRPSGTGTRARGEHVAGSVRSSSLPGRRSH